LIRKIFFATVFFILGVAVTVMYDFYDKHKWQLKFDIYRAMHTLKQIHSTESYDDALLRLRKNVACEVDNYVKRNKEVGFEIDQTFVDATLQQVQVSCE
jgi:hypothetical protein